MKEPLVLPVGRLFTDDETLLWGSSQIECFFYSIHSEYLYLFRESFVFQKAKRLGMKIVDLVEDWFEKCFVKALREILLTNEDGEIFYYTRKVLDGWYYSRVYCEITEVYIVKINERVKEFYYFRKALKNQGWKMTPAFSNTLVNEGVFLVREKDPTKRIPYDYMRKCHIRMG
ncbi:hypothetical protein CUS80_00315 [Enterococcus faecium]|uniref:hypothetical protein n=1 Tax=Enterococcus faecium TaxID=1352 RepID=UPI000CF34D7F|nr:hypothetical protein [Enterococcus faecium]PQG48416.1 hypothetical protein CUS80_00315 [Enterococcus faecium]